MDRASTLGEIREPARRIAPLAAEMASRLSSLKAPPADAAVLGRYRDLVRKQADDIARLTAAVDRGDMATVTQLGAAMGDYIARQRGIAEGYGFHVCGQGKM